LEKITNIAEEIKNRADIVDLIGRTVHLKRSGTRWVGLCPFHNEKTPSFYVNDITQTYKCFGCQEFGDIITFYEKTYNLDFLDAAEKLAKELNIDWERGSGGGKDKHLEKLGKINEEAAKFYYEQFWASNNPGYAYMKERGLSDETMKKFKLGYADGSRDKLLKRLQTLGVDPKDAAELGLLKAVDSKYRDKYFNRVMFPILDARGKFIGFSGRALGDGVPKYMNSDASKLFKKKDNLFALDLTGPAIRKAGFSFLVEGQMDVIAMYEHGYENVTASLGTALTPEQGAKLKKYADQVVVCYDADDSGVKAAIKSVDILRDKGLNVKVLSLPTSQAKDPDEFLRNSGRDAFDRAVKKASPGIAFKLNQVIKSYDLTEPEATLNFVKEAEEILKLLTPVEAEYYIPKLSKVAGIAEGAIRSEVFGDANPQLASSSSRSSFSTDDNVVRNTRDIAKENTIEALQRNIIRLILDDPTRSERLIGRGRVFLTPTLSRIYTAVCEFDIDEAGKDVEISEISERLDEEDRMILLDIFENIPLSSDPELQMADCLKRLEILELSEREKELLMWLETQKGDDENMAELMTELQIVQKQKRELSGK
jgi:DNA primase